MRRLFRILVLVNVFCSALATRSAHAEPPQLDFDQQIDVAPIVRALQGETGTEKDAPNASQGRCEIDFKTITLSLDRTKPYARATYEVDRNCMPNLKAVKYSDSVPVEAMQRRKSGGGGKSKELNLFGRSGPSTRLSDNRCLMTIWQEDVIGANLIESYHDISWRTEIDHIAEAYARVNAFPVLDWWHLAEDVRLDLQWINEPFTADSNSHASFYCHGTIEAPIPQLCKQGPAYPITLHGYFVINWQGRCDAQAHYTGTTVPFGRFNFEVFR